MMTMNIQPNVFHIPRKATEVDSTAEVEDSFTPATMPSPKAEETDTFISTTAPPKTDTEMEKEVDPSVEEKPVKKSEKSKASVLERRKRMKALKEEEERQSKQEKRDAKELHEAKISSAWWGALPIINVWAFVGNLFASPSAKAAKRLDVLSGKRDIEEAEEQEKQLKTAKLKSQFAPLLIIIPLDIISWMYANSKNTKIDTTGLSDNEVLRKLFQGGGLKNIGLDLRIFALACLAPLGYQFFEKTDDPNFNKGL